MKLKEVLAIIDSAIVLNVAGEKEIYGSKTEIQADRMSHIVSSIKAEDNSIVIILEEPPKTKSLEDLGYSFESGM